MNTNRKLPHEEIVERYIAGEDAPTIAADYGSVKSSIYKILNKYGVPRRKVNYCERKHAVNEDYFEVIDTPEKAYWLGFIYADGCVRLTGKAGGVFEITLQSSDKDHLVKLKDAIGFAGEIWDKTVKLKDKEYLAVKLQIGSYKFVNHLISNGCIPKKSLVLTFPEQLDASLYHHFIRGYFDGDGCIYVNSYNSTFSLLGTKEFLEAVQEILIDKCGLSKTKLIQKNNSKKNTYTLSYCGKQVTKIRDYLYQDEAVCLERKSDKFSQI